MSFLHSLKAAQSLSDTANILGYKAKSLSYVIYKMPIRYTTFKIPKKTGGFRTISAPVAELKLLQRRLSDGLQSSWDEINSTKNIKKQISHGFRRGASILTNATVHNGRRYVFNVDLKDFFDSINFGRVYGFFKKNKDFALTEDVAKVLSAIACHEGKLPQGSPCSPVISNLIGQIFDIRLTKLARQNGCSYSRYADDLTFSTNNKTLPSAISFREKDHSWIAGKALTKIIIKSGFELNAKKTRMQYCDSRQEVTGLIVNRRINTRSEYRRLTRAMTHKLTTTGKFHITKMVKNDHGVFAPVQVEGGIDHLQGIFGFIDWVDLHHRTITSTTDEEPSSISKTYKRFLMHRDFWACSLPVILCEGKTDSVYLRGAIRKLASAHPTLVSTNAAGKSDYKIRFFNYSHTSQRILDLSGGAGVVNKFITGYIKSVKKTAAITNNQPVILILDNDSGGKPFYNLIKQYSITKNPVDGMDDFYHLAANVYVVFTPISKPGDNSSIEDFFDSTLLSTKYEGKVFNPSNEGINSDAEYDKTTFATKVVRPNIAKIDFSKFELILTRIEKAIDAHNLKHAVTTK